MLMSSQIYTIKEQIEITQNLYEKLNDLTDRSEKLEFLKHHFFSEAFFAKNNRIQQMIAQLNFDDQYVLYSLLALGQGNVTLDHCESSLTHSNQLKAFLEMLKEVEAFYEDLGGLIGYHLMVLNLIELETKNADNFVIENEIKFLEPEGIDISQKTSVVNQFIRWGIESLETLAEIYPVGGAGDRLNLTDELTGELLPAAQLAFCGNSLIEGLIRDLQGREYLHYKLFGKQIVTPIAMMTSHEKHNHQRILKLFDESHCFNRPKESFKFFIQPLVPTIATDGQWAMHEPLKPILKPGGHGVIWKVAQENGMFEWLKNQGYKKALLRQINNPMAAIDYGLIAFIGIGNHHEKKFGFASCDRKLNMPEGMDVLRQQKRNNRFEYSLTNVEYTEFKKFGIEDVPREAGSPYSKFPANTNILFVDLETIKQTIKICPIPGMLLNAKTLAKCYVENNQSAEKNIGRLESTMQNIADHIIDSYDHPLSKTDFEKLKTFITFNQRSKTISITKQSYHKDKPINGTPEECFVVLMRNYHELLSSYCQMQIPSISDCEEEYIAKGTPFVTLFHPSLGGIYSVIGQKIHGGKINEGSEWVMEIADTSIENLDLDGSLLIYADSVMGHIDEKNHLCYSDKTGKCLLKNVKVHNEGSKNNSLEKQWKRQIDREESLIINLQGNGEFYAENVNFEGGFIFTVPDGHRLTISQQDNELISKYELITGSTWTWRYHFDKQNEIKLEKKLN